MPGFDDLKNAAKDIVDGAVENAKEAAEEIVGRDLDGNGVIGDGIEDGPVYGNTASVVDSVSEIAGNAPAAASQKAGGLFGAAAGVVGGAVDAAKGVVTEAASAAVDTVEGVTGFDINGDGAVAGAEAAEAAVEEAVDEAAAVEEAVDEAAAAVEEVEE